MNLQPIGLSRLERDSPWARQRIGWCRGSRPNGLSCFNDVTAAKGYADLDGAPFKAYYCPECAKKLSPDLK